MEQGCLLTKTYSKRGAYSKGGAYWKEGTKSNLRVSWNKNMTVMRGFQWGLPSAVKWRKN